MQDEEKRRDRETERTGTSQLSFMSSGWVSGPFVVLFGIPQQTTTGHIKQQVTGKSRCVCVCVCPMVFISTGHVYAPASASFHCTSTVHSVKWIYGCSPRFCMTGPLQQPFFSNHPFQCRSRFKAQSMPKVVTAVTRDCRDTGRGKPKRKLSRRKAHSQETQDNKPSTVL